MKLACALFLGLTSMRATAQEPAEPAPPAAEPWVVYEPGTEPGKRPGAGRHIVFVTGDEEYRSEEGMPQLAKILAKRHGFRCTVLFAIDPGSGAIDPGVNDNIPGLQALDAADLLVIFTRFRDLPDGQMAHVAAWVEAGKPIVGLRTATHAFALRETSRYRRFTWNHREWSGGFGRQVLGETWVAHHGGHGTQSTRGVVAPGMERHPILRGIAAGTVWDPSDVYTVRLPMREGIEPLLLGEVLAGMSPEDPPAPPRAGRDGVVVDKNDPMMPIAWITSYAAGDGSARGRVFTTTLGAAQAFVHEGTRRLLVNACYWALGLEQHIAADADVSPVGTFEPSRFGFGKHRSGVRPADLRE